MQEIDPQRTFDGFLSAARAYREAPGLMTALDLDEKAGRVRQSCYSTLKDEPLGRAFEQLLSSVRKRDPERVETLLEEIIQGLAGHGIGPEQD